MTRLDELLTHWREDSLQAHESSELASLLESPDNRRALVQEFWLAQAASEALGLTTCESGHAMSESSLDSEPAAPAARARETLASRSRFFLVLAASILLLAGAGLWFLLPRSSAEEAVARLVEVSGEVEVLTPSGGVFVASAGQALYPGQTLRTGDDGFAAIEYPDTTRLHLHADTVLRLVEPGRVVFSSGVVRADVAHRLPGKALVLAAPQVEVRASESRILIACSTPQTTRVDVEQGNAEVVRQSDGRSVEMEGGSYTVASMDLDPPIVRPLSIALNKPIRSIEFRQGRAAGYSDDGEPRLAFARSLRLVEKGIVRQFPLLGRKGEGQIVFVGDGKKVIVGGGNSLGVWNLAPFSAGKRWTTANLVQALASSGDGSRIASLDHKKSVVTLYDAMGQESHRLSSGFRLSRGLAISPDGGTVAIGSLPRVRGEWTVQLFDAASGKKTTALTGLDSAPRLLAFSPDGTQLAVAGKDGFQLYDLATRTLLQRASSHEQPLCSLAFSRDGKTLAGGSGDGQVWLWQTETGVQERQIKAGPRAVVGLAFSPDGTKLLTCGPAMPAQEWDLTEGGQ